MLKSIKDYTATVVNSIEMLTLRVYHQNSLLSHFNHRGHCVDFKLFSCPSRFSTLASKSKENSSITESKVVLVALMLENEFLLFNTSNNTFYSLSAQVSDCDIQNQIYLIKNQDLIKFDFELKNPKLVAKNVEKIWIQNEIFVKSKSKILQIDQSGTLLREIKAPCKELQQVKKYLFTNSDDRFVSIYDLSHKVDGQDTTTKVRTFGLDAVPVRMSCNEKYVCVLDQDGKINIIDHHTNQKSIIELNCGDHVFLDCLLDNHNLVVVYGTVFNPIMERVDILDKNGELRSHYVLTRIIKETSKSEKKVKLVSSANVKKLGKNSNFNEKIEQEQPEYLEEPSLQDQVKLLLGTDTLVKPKQESFTSLHLLLQQAITSGDLQMLEKALQITDRKIIHNTVRKLEPQVVVELIDQLVARLQKNANRGLMMIEWVKSCLVHHSAYLLTVINFNEVPQLTQKLGALYRGLENRQETFGRLLRLKGRLDMVCLQERYVDAEDEEVIVFDANGDASESEQDMQDIDSEYDYESEFDGIMLE